MSEPRRPDPFEDLRVEWRKLMDRTALPVVEALARLLMRRPWVEPLAYGLLAVVFVVMVLWTVSR